MKLVRDKIPGMHARGELGEHPQGSAYRDRQAFRRATREEYLLLLRCKLAEEVGEVLSAVTHEQLMEELGDVSEVLMALMDAEGWSWKDGDRVNAKEKHFGGYTEGWVLEEKQ